MIGMHIRQTLRCGARSWGLVSMLLLATLFQWGCAGMRYGLLPARTADVYTNQVVELSAALEPEELSDVTGATRVAIAVAEAGSVLFATAGGTAGGVIQVGAGRTSYRQDVFVPSLSGAGQLAPGAITVREQGPAILRLERGYEIIREDAASFSMVMDRTIRLLSTRDLERWLGSRLSADMVVVGYETNTRIRNPGPMPWTGRSSLPAIRVEGAFVCSRRSVVLAPISATMAETGQPGQATGARVLGKPPVFLLTGPEKNGLEKVVQIQLPTVPRPTTQFAILDLEHASLTLVAYSARPYMRGQVDGRTSAPLVEITMTPGSSHERVYRLARTVPGRGLAKGGITSHLRQTFQLQADVPRLLAVAARFCDLPLGDVEAVWQKNGLWYE